MVLPETISEMIYLQITAVNSQNIDSYPVFEIIVTLVTLIFAIPSLQILLFVQGVSPDIWRLFWSWTLLFWVLAAYFTTVAFEGTEELFVRLQLWAHLQERRILLNWCLDNISFALFRTMQKQLVFVFLIWTSILIKSFFILIRKII